MTFSMQAQVQYSVPGVAITVEGQAQALAEGLLTAITELACKTGWHSDYTQSVQVLPRTGDDIKFVVTWKLNG